MQNSTPNPVPNAGPDPEPNLGPSPTRESALIDEIVAGRFTDPQTGRTLTVPYEQIVIAPDLRGQERGLVDALRFGRRLAVVSDRATHGALGERIEAALAEGYEIDSVVLDHPHADENQVEVLVGRVQKAQALIAVGSGTVNDLCKYVTFQTGRPYAVFGTAASMNGYTSITSSITLRSGLKTSLPAQAARGVFLDLAVSAAAPGYLAAAGFGDSLCRSTAQVDSWLAHRLLGATYTRTPFAIQERDEAEMLAQAAGVREHDLEALTSLHRVLTLCGLGVSLTGTTNHGSMGEHQISHYIDCFAGARHPGTLHGQQVGVASVTMAHLQAWFLALDQPPTVRATVIDEADLRRRMGAEAAEQCLAQWRLKALDEDGAARLNASLRALWPQLREECAPFVIPPATLRERLREAGGPTTAAELGLEADFYREAVLHAREMRNRFSVLDLLADAGLLDDALRASA